MTKYYVNMNAQTTGEHEVHTASCSWLPAPENRKYLGEFLICSQATSEAKKHYNNVDGCFYCCNACHTR